MCSQQTEHGLKTWLRRRADYWQRLENAVKASKGRGRTSAETADTVVDGYRSLARDLSLAREVLPDGPLRRYLQVLYRDAHHSLYQQWEPRGNRLRRLYQTEIPAAFYALLPALISVTCIFIGMALAGWWLVHSYPELAALFASEQMVNEVQQGRLWTDGLLNVVPSSLLSLQIMSNNIFVSFMAFVMGAAYGLGTLYIIGMNGMMLGAIFAFTGTHGLDGRLFNFVVAHGIAELSIICLAGAAGVQLGEALARPGNRSRGEAFRVAVADGARLLWVMVPFLVLCGLVEGYVSPNPEFGLTLRVGVGTGLALLLFLVLSGRPWRARLT